MLLHYPYKDNKSKKEKYRFLEEQYNKGHTYLIQNNVSIFGPYPKSDVPWDISKAEKIAICNKEVVNLINWIKKNIIIKLGSIDYRTMNVLIRIATGMLNKINISEDLKREFHYNMVINLKCEYYIIIDEDLPF